MIVKLSLVYDEVNIFLLWAGGLNWKEFVLYCIVLYRLSNEYNIKMSSFKSSEKK